MSAMHRVGGHVLFPSVSLICQRGVEEEPSKEKDGAITPKAAGGSYLEKEQKCLAYRIWMKEVG